MKWTIEKIRELPKNNIFGITRISENGWQLESMGMVVITGDGGVLQFMEEFEKIRIENLMKWSGLE